MAFRGRLGKREVEVGQYVGENIVFVCWFIFGN
jgi:hypothetical protein